MAYTNHFRLYCITEAGDQFFDSALPSPPEVCPNNASHTVQAGSLTSLGGDDSDKGILRVVGDALTTSPTISMAYDDSTKELESEVVFNDSGSGTGDVWSAAKIAQAIADALASAMVFKGGYNAATNTPDLDVAPVGAETGDTYVTTVAGTFFTQALEIGDTLIAKIDNPAVLTDWAIVSKNYDFGNLTGQIPDIATSLSATQIMETDASSKLVTAAKGTAYNKNFGTGTTNVPEIGATLVASQTAETDGSGKLISTAKQTGYNLAKATTAEINTGTEASKLIPPDQLAGSKYLDQSGSKVFAVASDTDTYAATVTPAITAYAAGQAFLIQFTNANTGAATLNLNSLGAKALRKNSSTALASGDIVAGQIYLLVYDGTNLQLEGNLGSGSGASGYAPEMYSVWNTAGSTLGGNADTFAIVGGGAPSITATEANAQVRVPAGRVRGLSGRNIGGNSDCTFTVHKNGVATALTATQATGTGRFYITTGGPVTFAEGDLLSLRLQTTSGSGFTFSGITLHYESAVVAS